jgi:hypothetical protein
VWCLAASANGDVSHGDDGNLEGTALQHPDVEQGVTQLDAQAVNPAQRQQPFVDFNEIAFQILNSKFLIVNL